MLGDELCPFLLDLLQNGVLTAEGGELAYERRVLDSLPTIDDRSDLAAELHRKGYLGTARIPCQHGLMGTVTIDTIGSTR